MAKKFKRSSLVLGQVAQPATTPTLAGFFKDVSAGRRGAVEDITEGVETETRGLTGKLGLDETVGDDGKVSTKMGDKFRATVDTSGGTVYAGTPPPPPPEPGDEITGDSGSDTILSGGEPPPASTESTTTTPPSSTESTNTFTLPGGKTVTIPDRNDPKYKDNPQAWLDDVNKALADLGSNIQEWKDSGKEAEDFLNELLAKIREDAQGAIKDVNERITVGNLGKRREKSEVEKEAENYQNVIANEPGTSNIRALANLSKFYDMSRYGALESGLRQGELALSRQDMIGEKEAMGTAESARSAAVRDYGEQSKRLVGELEEGLTEQEKEQRKNLADYFKTGEEPLTGQETQLTTEKTDAQTAVDKKEEETRQENEKQLKTIESQIFGGEDPETGELRKGIANVPENYNKLQSSFNSLLKYTRGIRYPGVSKDKWIMEFTVIPLLKTAEEDATKLINLMKVAREKRDLTKLKDLWAAYQQLRTNVTRQIDKQEWSDNGRVRVNNTLSSTTKDMTW